MCSKVLHRETQCSHGRQRKAAMRRLKREGKIEQHLVSQIKFIQPESMLNCYIYYTGMLSHIKQHLSIGQLWPSLPQSLIHMRKIKLENFTFLNTLHLDERNKAGHNQPGKDFSPSISPQTSVEKLGIRCLSSCLEKWGRALPRDLRQSLGYKSPSQLAENILYQKSIPAPITKGRYGAGSFSLHCSFKLIA